MRKTGSITKSFTFDGRRYYVNAPNEREAFIKMIQKQNELLQSNKILDSSITLNEWSEICIDKYKRNLQDRSLYVYKNRMQNAILNHIGYMKLKNIKPINCQDVINAQEGKSQWYIRQTKQMMNFIFDKAVQNRLIEFNPSQYVELIKGDKSVRRSLTDEERKVFLEAVGKNKKYLVFELTYYLGARPTEAMNLKGEDIIDIDNTHYMWIKGTKTANANRKVPIPDKLYQKIKNCPKSKNIALSTIGKPLTEKQRQLYWKSLKRDMNILLGCKMYRNELLPPYPLDDTLCHYSLRHDYATRLAKAVPIEQAKYLLGHSDIMITSNTYQHLDTSFLDVEKIKCCT